MDAPADRSPVLRPKSKSPKPSFFKIVGVGDQYYEGELSVARQRAMQPSINSQAPIPDLTRAEIIKEIQRKDISEEAWAILGKYYPEQPQPGKEKRNSLERRGE